MYTPVFEPINQKYVRETCTLSKHYYHALRIEILIAGEYGFSGSSSVETIGSIYSSAFDPYNPSSNRIANDYNGCGKTMFWLQHFLQANATYILVVTMLASDTFLVVSKGVANVSFTRLGQYDCSRMFVESSCVKKLYSLGSVMLSFIFDAVEGTSCT